MKTVMEAAAENEFRRLFVGPKKRVLKGAKRHQPMRLLEILVRLGKITPRRRPL